MALTAGAGPLVKLAAKTNIPVATLQAYPWLARVLGGAAGGELGGELSGEPPGVGALKGGIPALIGEGAMGAKQAVVNKTFPWTEAGRKAIATGDLARIGQTMSEVAPTLQPGTTSNAVQRTAEGQGLGRINAAKEQWAARNAAEKGLPVTMDDLLDFLPGRAVPVCPSGGHYYVNRIGAAPVCTVAGHTIAAPVSVPASSAGQ